MTEVNGCRWCGVPQRDHAQRWRTDAGMHTYEPPSDRLRLLRMRENNVAEIKATIKQRPSRYGREFDELATRWANLEREHDEEHPDRDECGGIGGCSMMARAVSLVHLMEDALVDWRLDRFKGTN